VDREGNPWFVVKDICEILEIKNPSDAIKHFSKDEKSVIVLNYIGKSGKTIPNRHLIINEDGLYHLIIQSRKPVAEQLQTKIYKEILPLIRKYGLNNASRLRIYAYGDKEGLTWSEYINKLHAKHPENDFEGRALWP
jgi:prophage antirepressor-like protein